MKIRNLSNRITGALLGLSLLLVVGVGFTTVHAQDRYPNDDQNRRNWDRYGNYGGSAELRQTALNAGYNEGIRAGRDDRQNRRQSNYQSSGVYRRATQNYNSRLGDRTLYQRYFREAFESGYNFNGDNQGDLIRNDRSGYPDRNNTGDRTRRGRNWDNYGNFGGSNQLRQTALNAGYNEGLKDGRNDRRKGRYADFQNSSAYQKATQDYSSRLGDRELYRRYYREGFTTGYSDGSNGY